MISLKEWKWNATDGENHYRYQSWNCEKVLTVLERSLFSYASKACRRGC